MFDWPRFLDQHRIDYVTSGPNVSRDHVAVRCPFCTDDPSQHMSVSVNGQGWRCFRNHGHRGRNPVRLVQALLRCSWEQAQRLVGTTTYIPADFAARVARNLQPKATTPSSSTLDIPNEFYPFDGRPSSKPFVGYLKGRDRLLLQPQIDRLTSHYDVMYCTRGPYRYRIIFLVHHQGKLVSWTGRTINRDEPLRYKSLSDDPERASREGLPPALGPVSSHLLWYDDLVKSSAHTIYLCEGPFDALKVNLLGRGHGICATCFFTSAPTAAQVELMHTLLPRFERRHLLLDQGALPLALKIAGQLRTLNVTIKQLPKQIKDPALLNAAQLLNINIAGGAERA